MPSSIRRTPRDELLNETLFTSFKHIREADYRQLARVGTYFDTWAVLTACSNIVISALVMSAGVFAV